jgi:transketolase
VSGTIPIDEELAAVAGRIRKTVVEMCVGRGQGYAGQGLALAELMACLHFDELVRDGADHRFVLSTGHSAIALFAALGERGIYQRDELLTYGTDGSRIEESPLEGTPGFEITGGALGQGVSQAVGLALGERLRGTGRRIYCVVSDGELQEGQVWEALMSAAHHRLDNLVVIVDNNRMQADGDVAEVLEVEPVPEKLESFGLAATRVAGDDIAGIRSAFEAARATHGRPTAVVLDTVPGKGVPSFEAYSKVHYIRAEHDVWRQALSELDVDVPDQGEERCVRNG